LYCSVYKGNGEKQTFREHPERDKGALQEGFREVTLLGQNVNSYRSDINFAGLLREINSIPA